MDFIAQGVRYNYGFEVTNQKFIAEWLYTYPRVRRKRLFERNFDSYRFGWGLKGHNKDFTDMTRANSLYLSACVQSKYGQLSDVIEFFRSLDVDRSIQTEEYYRIEKLDTEKYDERVIKFLNNIGSGVIGYREQERDIFELFSLHYSQNCEGVYDRKDLNKDRQGNTPEGKK